MNFNSDLRLKKLIYEELGAFKSINKGGVGVDDLSEVLSREKDKISTLSVGNEVFAKKEKLIKFLETYIDYAKESQIVSSYESISKHVAEDGCIHSDTNLAVTGRGFTVEPNVQAVGANSDVAKMLCSRFENGIIASFDFSQVEYKILAVLSGDESLKEAFNQGLDIHAYTASVLNGKHVDKVTSSERTSAKAINFGLIYGKTAYSLKEDLGGISQKEAEDWISVYFEKFPAIKVYVEQQKQKAKKLGYVESLHGRRFYLDGINSPDFATRQREERKVVNYPCQGTASEVMKISLCQIQKMIDENGYKSKILTQVHDDIKVDIHPDELSFLPQKIKNIMENSLPVSDLPLTVSAEMGNDFSGGRDVVFVESGLGEVSWHYEGEALSNEESYDYEPSPSPSYGYSNEPQL